MSKVQNWENIDVYGLEVKYQRKIYVSSNHLRGFYVTDNGSEIQICLFLSQKPCSYQVVAGYLEFLC